MVHTMDATKTPASPRCPVKEKIVGIYDSLFKVRTVRSTGPGRHVQS